MNADTTVLAQAAIDLLDKIANTMERKWGIDRLPHLVDPALASRFHAQAYKLNQAIASGRPDAIKIQAEAMARAWSALDKAANANGAEPLAAHVWEAMLPTTGEVIAIVRTQEEASAIARERKGAVWTLEEVARAIEAFGEQVRAVKRAFPGAEVMGARPSKLNIGAMGQKPAAGSFSDMSRRGGSRRRKKTNLWPSGLEIAGSSLADNAKHYDWEKGDDIPLL
jgi:hypothetical protein